MAYDFNKKRLIAIVILVTFIATLYGGFRYRQYTEAPGRRRTFTGTVTFAPNNTPCKYYEIDKNTIVRVSCNGELNITPFVGQYDKSIKLDDKVEVRAVRFNPNGATKYKMYDIRATNTYVKKR